MKPFLKALRSKGVVMVKKLLSLLPVQDTILFESSPDFACNTYPVFLMLRKELPEYKMVWAVTEKKAVPNGVDDTFLIESNRVFPKLKTFYYMCTAKAVVFSNRVIDKCRPGQVHIFLGHGSKTKKTRGVYEPGANVDYINVQSHFFDDIVTYEYNCEKEKLVYLGYPRCDSFFVVCPEEVKRKLHLDDNSRYFVWLPTFRKHRNHDAMSGMHSGLYSQLGMPLVYDMESLASLEKFLDAHNMVIYFKPHPAQDVSGLVRAQTRNIRIIKDTDLADMDVSLYDLLAASDGLITDYSSVFFDYLLADKPIATTTDDMEEWKKMTGFAFDLDAFLDEATTRISSLQGLYEFLEGIDRETDRKAAGRKRIRELTNIYYDGDSAKRVAAFIREKIGV